MNFVAIATVIYTHKVDFDNHETSNYCTGLGLHHACNYGNTL